MAQLDEQALAKALEEQLTRPQIVAFAWRMALRALPQLSTDGAWSRGKRRSVVDTCNGSAMGDGCQCMESVKRVQGCQYRH